MKEHTDLLSAFERHVIALAKPMNSDVLNLLHGAVGVSGEAGELLDAIKKVWAYEKPLTPEVWENLLEETGDILFYLTIIANVSNFTLFDAMEYNIKKLSARYPQGYSNEAALTRADKEPNA